MFMPADVSGRQTKNIETITSSVVQKKWLVKSGFYFELDRFGGDVFVVILHRDGQRHGRFT